MQTVARYPWDRWFGFKRFRLVRGKHYHCMPHSMGVQVRTAASKRDVGVSVLIREDVVTVMVLSKPRRRKSKRSRSRERP